MRPILGKTALLGITSYDRQGTLIRQEQFVGKVEWADDQHGIVIRCDNGDTKTVPPDFRAVLYAPRGTYRHQATGEVVTDPNYLLSWRTRPAEDANSSAEWKPNYAPFFQYGSPRDWEFEYRFDEQYVKELIEVAGRDYLSKQILMGITHCRSVGEDEEVVRQEQLYGKIVRISYEEGVVVLLADGNETDLPPDLSLIQPGPPGRYRLRSTGEAVEDPDFITMWEEGEAREPS